MKLVIVGYGKMGQAVERSASDMGIVVSKIIKNTEELKSYNFAPEEVAIEFTAPASCFNNIKILAGKGVSVVCGTTGWYEELSKFKELVRHSNIGFIYGENFSIGVHLFWKAVAVSAKIFNQFPIYDVSLHEVHHQQKKDAPSGTAKKTAEILIKNFPRKNKFVVSEKGQIAPHADDELQLTYSRIGEVVGQHIVQFDSDIDTIEITHTSKGRQSYALGAIKCAQWLAHKKGFFNIDDYIKSI